MVYNIAKPSVYLSQYVKHYWSLVKCLPENIKHTQRIVPSGLFELVFYLNDKPVSSDKNKSITDSVILSGHQKDYYDLHISGKLSLFAIYFHPHGLAMFLNLPVNEIFNQSVPLRFLLKDQVNKLEDKLSAAISFKQCIIIAESFIAEQINKNEKKYQYNRIRNAVEIINKNKGLVEIEALAAESCLSRKQFERTFLDIIGATPKQFLKIVRFQHAIYQKSKHPDLNLTEIAYVCGYYDQAHMINDFKTLSGFTPRQFFGDCEPFSDYFE